MKKTLLEYGITTLVGLLITFLLLWSKGIFTETDLKEVYKYWVDSLFTSGVLISCAGAIVVVSDGGAFDMLVYGMYRFFSIFRSKPNDVKYKTFYDYRVARSDKEKHGFWYLVIVGAIFIIASLVILYFWYQIPEAVNP